MKTLGNICIFFGEVMIIVGILRTLIGTFFPPGIEYSAQSLVMSVYGILLILIGGGLTD